MTDELATVDTEHERVNRWRLQQLVEAGYPVETAEQLAARVDVDLHRAVELVEAGCPPVQAAAILL